jgi:hypothetical protein
VSDFESDFEDELQRNEETSVEESSEMEGR